MTATKIVLALAWLMLAWALAGCTFTVQTEWPWKHTEVEQTTKSKQVFVK